MSGLKADKFRIILGFGCNADGSEKLFIGKYKVPRCFQKKAPRDWGFDYESNKSAWMTASIFEQYVSGIHQSLSVMLTYFI